MFSGRTRQVVLAAGVLGTTITGVGFAATGDPFREGQRNGTATRETSIVANAPATNAATGGFTTRQSNLSTSGGGAVYGCRSTAGGTAANPPKNPCIRANNLSTGFAFEFNASNGDSAGRITVGNGGDAKTPFTTNATGVATGLNADRVDGSSADQIVTSAVTAARAKENLDADTVDGLSSAALKDRWALIDENGAVAASSGGFTVVTAYPGGANAAGNQNVYINVGEDASDNGLTSSIAIQNTTANGNPNNFGGEISIGACGLASINCVPPNTEDPNVIVVSPRNSDGTVTAAGARKRFYVNITE